MAWQWLQLLLVLVLTGTVLLVSVQGWERINNSELTKFYKSGQWSEPFSFTADEDDGHSFYKYLKEILKESRSVTNKSTPRVGTLAVEVVSAGKSSSEEAVEEATDDDYDNYEDEVPEEVKGLAISEMVDPLIDREKKPDVKESEFHVEFIDVPPKNWTGCVISSSKGIDVVCNDDGFQITLPPGHLSQVLVAGFTNISVEEAPAYCGYNLNQPKNILTVAFTGCNVREDVEDIYNLQLSVSISGRTQEFIVFCIENTKFDAGQFPRAFDRRTKCNKRTVAPPTTTKPSRCSHKTTTSPRKWIHRTAPPVMPPDRLTDTLERNYKSRTSPPKPHNCAVYVGEQIPCGRSGISPSNCEKRGCCWDFLKYNCYYPLDECTADQHFVFAIRRDCTTIPLDPRDLGIPGSPLCKPAIVNDEVAIFKIELGDCGSHSYDVGDMKIYLIEVHTVVNALNLKYGIITRSDPLRFLIECRFHKHYVAGRSLASAGYMVKSSTSNLPSSVISTGLYDVELKIAKDKTYSSYFPTYHQPLQLLLGHPVYLELNLRSTKSDAVLLVNYCLAYPRSAKNALVLIHEGCANPNDQTVSILKVGDLPNNRRRTTRRFVVEAFQFMVQKTNMYLNEEIYFVCAAEVCLPSERPCEEQCFDGIRTL